MDVLDGATRAGFRRVTGEVLVLAAEPDGLPRPALAVRLAALFPHGAVPVHGSLTGPKTWGSAPDLAP